MSGEKTEGTYGCATINLLVWYCTMFNSLTLITLRMHAHKKFISSCFESLHRLVPDEPILE